MSMLFFYKLVFMTELIIAEGIFSFRMERRKHFLWRLLLCLVVCYGIALLYPLASYSGWYASLMFISFFVITYLGLLFCFEITWMNGFFIAITSYTVQHLAYELYSLMSQAVSLSGALSMYSDVTFDLTNITSEMLFTALIYVDIYIVVYAVSYVLLGKKIHRNKEIQINNGYIFLLACLILLVDIIINAFVVYIDSNANRFYEIVIAIYNIICCILVFCFQFSIVNAKKMRQEIETTQSLLVQAKKQYELSRENINAINMKCHNLKYQVNEFARKGGIDDKSISEIQDMISIYDTQVRTGNEALDIILTEKSMLCHNRGIQLTCMAEGSSLSFINESDLYVLFGNAIDNAIEAVSKLKDEKKRYIGLTVRSVNNFISININNFYEQEIHLDGNGLPITSKDDKNNHGFGIRSIKMIVENYKGDFSVILKDHVFNINILIPIVE